MKPDILRQQVAKDIHYGWFVHAMRAACTFKWPELIGETSLSAEDIAAQSGTRPSVVVSVLLYLTTFGYFELVEMKHAQNSYVFRNTALSRALGELAEYALYQLGTPMQQRWLALEHLLQTGENAPTSLYGKPLYQHLEEFPSEREQFDRALSQIEQPVLGAIANAFPFAGRVVDVGGGIGGLLQAIKAVHPNIQAILFERPEVMAGLSQPAFAQIELIQGDFFTDALPLGDQVILKHVLHNHPDEACLRLLQNCRQALAPEGTLIICELLMPSNGQIQEVAAGLSLQMKLEQEGQQRSEAQLQNLLQEAGLALTRVLPVAYPSVLLLARVA